MSPRSRGRFELLAGAMAGLLLAQPLVTARGGVTTLALTALLLGVLVAAIRAVGRTTAAYRWALVLGAAAVVLSAVAFATGHKAAALSAHASFAFFFAAVVVAILGFVLAPGRITADRIYGSICAYLLLGLLWAFVYALIETAAPGAFTGAIDAVRDEGVSFVGQFFYYSFVTLTTLGFGDISPAAPFARSVTAIEAIAGQLFLAILVARLVGLHLSQSAGDERGDEPSSSDSSEARS